MKNCAILQRKFTFSLLQLRFNGGGWPRYPHTLPCARPRILSRFATARRWILPLFATARPIICHFCQWQCVASLGRAMASFPPAAAARMAAHRHRPSKGALDIMSASGGRVSFGHRKLAGSTVSTSLLTCLSGKRRMERWYGARLEA